MSAASDPKLVEPVAWLTDWQFKMPEGENLVYPGGGSSLARDAVEAARKLAHLQEWDRVDWVRQMPLVPASALEAAEARIAALEAENGALREALGDLVSWFDGGPHPYGPWLIKAGKYGVDDAVEHARAALRQAEEKQP